MAGLYRYVLIKAGHGLLAAPHHPPSSVAKVLGERGGLDFWVCVTLVQTGLKVCAGISECCECVRARWSWTTAFVWKLPVRSHWLLLRERELGELCGVAVWLCGCVAVWLCGCVCVCVCVWSVVPFLPGLPGWTCMATLASSGRVAPNYSRPSVQARGASLYCPSTSAICT